MEPKVLRVGDRITLRGTGYSGVVLERDGDAILIDGQGGYEVCIVQRHPKDHVIRKGWSVSAGDEFLPASEEWGTLGWTPPLHKPSAQLYFRALADALKSGQDPRDAIRQVREEVRKLIAPSSSS